MDLERWCVLDEGCKEWVRLKGYGVCVAQCRSCGFVGLSVECKPGETIAGFWSKVVL